MPGNYHEIAAATDNPLLWQLSHLPIPGEELVFDAELRMIGGVGYELSGYFLLFKAPPKHVPEVWYRGVGTARNFYYEFLTATSDPTIWKFSHAPIPGFELVFDGGLRQIENTNYRLSDPTTAIFVAPPVHTPEAWYPLANLIEEFPVPDGRKIVVPSKSSLYKPQVFVQSPGANLDYEFDWSKWIGENDAIQSSEWSADAGVEKSDEASSDTYATAWLSGAERAANYTIINTITTQAGRQDSRSFKLKIQEL